MVKNIFILTFSILLIFRSGQVHAEIGPKAKAVMIMAAYGTVGGALLGTASLAFGTSGRSVAKGASLGLYAGLLFGSYVLISYKMKRDRDLNPQAKPDYYPDTTGSPYEAENSDPDAVPENQRNVNLNNIELIENFNYQKRHEKILFYMPLFRFQF